MITAGGAWHIALDWTEDEQRTLEDHLARFPPERYDALQRYVKLASLLPRKSVRDVALRCRWTLQQQVGVARGRQPEGRPAPAWWGSRAWPCAPPPSSTCQQAQPRERQHQPHSCVRAARHLSPTFALWPPAVQMLKKRKLAEAGKGTMGMAKKGVGPGGKPMMPAPLVSFGGRGREHSRRAGGAGGAGGCGSRFRHKLAPESGAGGMVSARMWDAPAVP